MRSYGRSLSNFERANSCDRMNKSLLLTLQELIVSSTGFRLVLNGTITADQKQRSITGENRSVIPELGNAEVSLTRSGAGLILSVTRQDGRPMKEAVVSDTPTGLLFAFTPQPVPIKQTGYNDPLQPRRLPRKHLHRNCRGVPLLLLSVISLSARQRYQIRISSTSQDLWFL